MAYYRAQESKKNHPLFNDPFAERLAGDMNSYFKKDESFAINDYPLIRSYYIDNHLLIPWCKTNSQSQIVILGAGLDTRAYRISELRLEKHVMYEIDYPEIIHYKEEILQNELPFCNLIRVSVDISNSEWYSQLIDSGFTPENTSFWILEGLAYYIEKENFKVLLKQISNMSIGNDQIFVDICDPVCAEVDFGPFFRHFKWGLTKEEIVPFFSETGWEVSFVNAEDYDHGRFVGTGIMMFVQGKLSRV